MRISDWSSDVCSSDLFNTGVATANNCHTLALEQRTIAVRAVGHTVVAVFALAGRVDFAPARAGCQNDSLAFHVTALGQPDLGQALARHQRLAPARAPWRDTACQYVSISVVAGSLKK